MNEFDRDLKRMAAEEPMEVPASVKKRIEETLEGLPEKEAGRRPLWVLSRVAAAAACLILVTLFLLPNMSVAYAQALERVPVIGDLVRVVTIKNYLYADEKHEMDIEVPKVEQEEMFDPINAEVEEMTQSLVQRFYQDLESIGRRGHSSIYVDYETVTDTGSWFTLKLQVHEAAGSSNTYFKYYHLNKITGETIRLGDLVADDAFYEVVEQRIKEQMLEAEERDDTLEYWVEDEVFGDDHVSIDGEHNFYWNEEGDLVIPFDKYEVAPGYMGTSEFTVDREEIRDYLKVEFQDLF